MNRMIENTRRLVAAGLLVLTASCSTSTTLVPSALILGNVA